MEIPVTLFRDYDRDRAARQAPPPPASTWLLPGDLTPEQIARIDRLRLVQPREVR